MFKYPFVFIITSIAFISGCTSPSLKFHKTAVTKKFNSVKLTTAFFQHIIYSNAATLKSPEKVLHIYLDGDGSPWIANRRIAKDPTARNPMILDLMQQDKAPAILLGRPCYYGLHTTSDCHYRYWTSHRYGESVVESMSQALTAWLLQHPNFKQLTFIGYSGGGTLAVLLAPHFKRSRQVITLAANLDISAWTKRHGYSPLTGSLNPINLAPLRSNIKQLHIAGDQDTNVPASIAKSFVESQASASILILKNQSHCCWRKQWSSILSMIDK